MIADAPSAGQSSRPENLPALTGLRFFAALHVMVFHFADPLNWRVPEPLRLLGHAGPAAVTLFFVLSGFVLAHTYAVPGRPPTRGPVLYAARLARILPMYVVGFVASAPLWGAFLSRSVDPPTAGRLWLLHGAASAFTVQAWFPPLALTWNPPAWSISVELFFYACFVPLSAWLMRIPLPNARAVAIIAWLMGLAAPAWYVLAQPPEDPVVHPWRNLVDFFPLLRLPDFVIGIVAARAWHQSPRRTKDAWVPVVIGIVGSCALAGSGLVNERFVHNGLLAPFFVMVVWGLASGGGALGRVFSNRVSVLLGDASYGMYLLHMPVIFWAAALARHASPAGIFADPEFTVPLFPVVMVVCVALHRVVEVPMRVRLRARLQAAASRFLTSP